MFSKYTYEGIEGHHYLSENTFSNCKYYLWVSVDSDKAYVNLSSGNKRKHKFLFEEKEVKSKGGLQALVWAKDQVLSFNDWYKENYPYEGGIKYLYVFASDSRRRKIYRDKLSKYGFKEERIPVYGMGLCKRY